MNSVQKKLCLTPGTGQWSREADALLAELLQGPNKGSEPLLALTNGPADEAPLAQVAGLKAAISELENALGCHKEIEEENEEPKSLCMGR